MFGKKKNKDAVSATPDEASAKRPIADASSTAAQAGAKGKETVASSKAASTEATARPTKPAKAEKAVKPAKQLTPAKPAKVKAEKGVASPKAKGGKRKNSLAKGGPGFFAAHVEKMILAATLTAVGYLVYAGFSAPGYDTAAAPDKLEKDAKDLLTKISQDHWEAIAADPARAVEHDFATQAAEARRPTDPGKYDSAVWDPKPLGVFEKRGDPQILAPEHLVVQTVSGALAVEVPIDDLEAYDALEDAEIIRARERAGTARGGRPSRGGRGSDVSNGSDTDGMGMGAGSMSMGMGSMGMGAGGVGGKDAQRFLRSDYNLGVIFGGAAGGMGAGSMGMGMGAMGSMGSTGSMGGPMGGGSMQGGTSVRDGLQNKDKDRGPKFKVGTRAILFNSITAIVPHRKMVEEYLKQFEESGSFTPQRDLPFYMSFELQRVDVTSDPLRDIREEEWTPAGDGLEHTNFPLNQKWATRPPLGRPVPEVIDRNASAGGLTMPIPPLLLRDYRQFSKHPDIHWAWDARSSMARRPRRTDQTPKENTVLPGARGGNAAGMGAGGMGSMGMMGSMGGMGGGRGEGYGDDSMGMGAMGSMGSMGSMGAGDGGYGDDSMGSMGSMGMMGSMGSMGGGMMGSMGGGMGMSAAMQPEYKMVRCYDMLNPARDYAKVFRYRIRLLMRDPNYPDDGRLPRPAPNTLTDKAWARVAPLIAKEDSEVKANPSFMRTLRKTDWSAASPPARVEIPIEVLAGEVKFDGPRTFEADDKSYTLTVSEPTASVVATVMDSTTGARFAMQRDVRRGSVLTDKADLELIVPNSSLVKIDKDKPVDARATVVDIRGGKPLAGDSRDDPLSDIGEMLILNRDGSLSVSNEFDDTFLVRMYTFADEHEQAAKSTNSSTTNSYGGGYGDGSGAGDSGSGSGGGRGR